MDRWSTFFIRWKLLLGLFLPLALIVVALVLEQMALALGALLFLGTTAVVVYLFAEYANDLL